MKRSEILIVLGLVAFGIIYQFVDSGRSPSEISAIRWIHELKSGPMETVERTPLIFNNFQKAILTNPAGDISLRNSKTGQMEIIPTIECYHATAREAAKMASSVAINHSVNKSGVLALQVIVPRKFDYRRLRVRLDIRLPESPEIEIHSGYGLIETKQLRNPVELFLKYGDLEVSGHHATLIVHHAHGRLQLEGIRTAMKIQSSFSQITATRCGGGIIQGHQARIQLDQIRGDLFISNVHNRIVLRDIFGSLNIESSDCPIDIRNLSGTTVAIKTSYKPLKVRHLSIASMDIMASHGKLNLEFSEISDTLSIKARHSRISLSLPPEIEPMINAQLKYGRFSNRSQLKIDVEKTPVYHRAVSFTGSPVVVVDGRYSDLDLSQNPKRSDSQSD